MDENPTSPVPEPEPEPEESFAPLPDTPESRRARKWLFRVIAILVLINVGVLTWVVVSGLLRDK